MQRAKLKGLFSQCKTPLSKVVALGCFQSSALSGFTQRLLLLIITLCCSAELPRSMEAHYLYCSDNLWMCTEAKTYQMVYLKYVKYIITQISLNTTVEQ